MKFIICHSTACVVTGLLATLCSAADLTPALSVTDGLSGIPGENSVHGWEFVANDSIRVTHLGLYDHLNDGFLIDHPIGLFRFSDAVLLTSGTILQGVDNPLLNDFRYIDTPDITLNSEGSYVIAFYSSASFKDRVITNPLGLTFNSAITFTAALANTGSFGMPTSVQQGFHRIGPNFLFEIPESPTVLLANATTLVVALNRRASRLS